MIKSLDHKGTTSLAEYAVTVFLVVATITAMTIYIQRTLQARMRDARHYMVKTVGEECDQVYCGPAANLGTYQFNVGGLPAGVQRIGDQYEPYYAQVNSIVDNDRARNKRLVASSGSAGIFMDDRQTTTNTSTYSNQAAPSYARTDRDRTVTSDRY